MIKGVILAGGNGTRLLPLTKVVNKSLLPILDKPMIQHCVEKFTAANIREIMIVTGGEHLGVIAEFLGSGKDFNCSITYKIQDTAGGIAQALSLAEHFVGNDNICVLLGDNIFESPLNPLSTIYKGEYAFPPYAFATGAMVILKQVEDPQRFGVATIDAGRVIKIVEKPKIPESNYAVTGIYFYDNEVFDIIRDCRPSGRGELEITDVNNKYIRRDAMRYAILDGWWTDAGTHESYQKANQLYKESKDGNKSNSNGQDLDCPF